MSKEEEAEILLVGGHEVRVTHPEKPYFTRETKLSKLDVVKYFLSVADGALFGIAARPIVLKRFVDGAEADPFYQKRAPSHLPAYVHTATLKFPSGRTADEVVIDNAAGLAWVANLGCIELHPHPVRETDLDHPDELRVDLDPGPGVEWSDVRKVALEVKALLEEMGLTGWPKTSGSRGIHVNARIFPNWNFDDVRRAALALSREIERRAPTIATSKWWKEERKGVFLDYNQNAKDRTTCSAYSIRPLPDARVSTPLEWSEVADCNAADFTVLTVPKRFAERGNPHAKMNEAAGSLEKLLELAARDEASGLGDAPWPPHFRKGATEGARVAPSRANALRDPRRGKKPKNPDAPSAPKKARSKKPLLTIANSQKKDLALEGLERWKNRHSAVLSHLLPEDILIDSMRGRSSTWTRIRVNLEHVPEEIRPAQETPDPDDDPTRAWRESFKKKIAADYLKIRESSSGATTSSCA